MQTRIEETHSCRDGCQTMPSIEIRPLQTDTDRDAFRSLNEEWISRYFVLEKKDREILDDPESSILSKGGHILVVQGGDSVIGCVALIPIGRGVYELSKMAVSPLFRGLGIGRKLLDHAIAHARESGAKSLFLGSSTKLDNAVRLYESVGFHHVPAANVPPMPYARADVFMEMQL